MKTILPVWPIEVGETHHDRLDVDAMRTLRWLSLFIVAFVWTTAPAVPAGREILEIATKSGVKAFMVELATTEAERSKGLMDRHALPEGQRMLFDFHREQEVGFWMKNTYIPLHMIFIRADGRIHRIAENTEPLSEKIVPSNGQVRAVLELIGGSARKLGIAPGDRVAHRIFSGR